MLEKKKQERREKVQRPATLAKTTTGGAQKQPGSGSKGGHICQHLGIPGVHIFTHIPHSLEILAQIYPTDWTL